MKHTDFSKKSTDKAVLSETVQHPLTLGFATLGIFGGAASLLFSAGTLPVALGVGGMSLALFSWLINYVFRKEIFTARHIEKLQKLLDRHKEDTIKQIETELRVLEDVPGLQEFCQQGREQFHRSQEKYQNLTNILRSKISSSELTFSRYKGTAEQVYLAILDNLLQVVHSLQSIRPIDINYIEGRLNSLSNLGQLSEPDKKEIETLKVRVELRENQIALINDILTQNEEAMTMLDKTSAAIAHMSVGVSQSEQTLSESMKDLEDLAKRTTKY